MGGWIEGDVWIPITDEELKKYGLLKEK